MFKLFKSFNKKDLVLIITCISLVALHVWLEFRIPDYMSQITQLVQTEGSKMSAIIEQGSFMIICAVQTQRLDALDLAKRSRFGNCAMYNTGIYKHNVPSAQIKFVGI